MTLALATRPAVRRAITQVHRQQSILKRRITTLRDHRYTAVAEASGFGRHGKLESNGINMDFSPAKELGGPGNGTNPQQLLALGYAACLLSSIQMASRQMGPAKVEQGKKAVVGVSVAIGEADVPGGFKYGMAIDIKVAGIDEELLKAGHEACPYQIAMAPGIQINIATTEDDVEQAA